MQYFIRDINRNNAAPAKYILCSHFINVGEYVDFQLYPGRGEWQLLRIAEIRSSGGSGLTVVLENNGFHTHTTLDMFCYKTMGEISEKVDWLNHKDVMLGPGQDFIGYHMVRENDEWYNVSEDYYKEVQKEDPKRVKMIYHVLKADGNFY